MNSLRRLARRGGSFLTAVAFVAAAVAPVVISHDALAYGQFSSRKLTMSSQASGNTSTDANGNAVAAGSGGNGAKAVHSFNFSIGTTGNVGSILIMYCNSPLLDSACVAPTGLDASTITTIGSQTGFSANNFTLDTSTVANSGTFFGTIPCSGVSPYRTNCVLIKRATAASETAAAAAALSFGVSGTNYIKNPTSNGVFYARVYSFSDIAYTTTQDAAGLTGSVNTGIDITAKVQEKLNFSVAASTVPPTTSCTPLSGTGAISLGDATYGVLDTTVAYDAHSYFRLSTNASGGTTVLYSGDTLKTANGVNSITQAGASAVSSAVGSSQFGLALDSSDTQAGNGYSFTNLTATSPYAGGAGTITNAGTAQFAFNATSVTSPIQVASAASGTTVSCDTGSVRYIGNIAPTTKAGIYRTTISYIAVPTY